MSKIHDGGPAFPFTRRYDEMIGYQEDGMTIRDYFAAKVMQAMLTNATSLDVKVNKLTEYSYGIADEMLKERAKAYEKSNSNIDG